MKCPTCTVSPCEDPALCAILQEEEAIERQLTPDNTQGYQWDGSNRHYYARKAGTQLPQDDWLEGFSDGFRGIGGYPPRYGPPGASERYWDGYEAGLCERVCANNLVHDCHGADHCFCH